MHVGIHVYVYLMMSASADIADCVLLLYTTTYYCTTGDVTRIPDIIN